MLRFGAVEITESYEPPRPVLVPRRRVQVQRPVEGIAPNQVLDWGLEGHWVVRFSSNANQGIVTTAQRDALIALYKVGQPFTLVTDLLKPLVTEVESDTYIARFAVERGSEPLFTPATPDGAWHFFDIPLRVQ